MAHSKNIGAGEARVDPRKLFRNAKLASELPSEYLGDFDDLEWVQAIIRDPAWEEIVYPSRTITRNSTTQSLFSRTFATLDTWVCSCMECIKTPFEHVQSLRACQAFARTHDAQSGEKSGASVHKKEEAIVIVSLGRGLDGHPGLAHGGTIAALFDECLGVGAVRVLTRPSMTGQLTIKYKAPVPTPSVVLVRCSLSEHEGRKAWVSGTMEDGMGKVYAESEALFIMQRDKL